MGLEIGIQGMGTERFKTSLPPPPPPTHTQTHTQTHCRVDGFPFLVKRVVVLVVLL